MLPGIRRVPRNRDVQKSPRAFPIRSGCSRAFSFWRRIGAQQMGKRNCLAAVGRIVAQHPGLCCPAAVGLVPAGRRLAARISAPHAPPPLGSPQRSADWQLMRGPGSSSQSAPRRDEPGGGGSVLGLRPSCQSLLRRDKPGGGDMRPRALECNACGVPPTNGRRDLPLVAKNGLKKCTPRRTQLEKCLKVSSTRSEESSRKSREIRTPRWQFAESMFHHEK